MRAGLLTTAAVGTSLALAACGSSTGTPAAPAPVPKPHTAQVNQALSIQHVLRGCHVWSTGTAKTVLHISTGSALTITNNDVMPHKLVSSGGLPAVLSGADMSHMSAKGTITFPKAGTYRFTTKAGEDYMKGVKTVGEDNVLRLTIVVT
jgi:hypothetical protein